MTGPVRLCILAEGETEAQFVVQVLKPELIKHNILVPKKCPQIGTSRKHSTGGSGGDVSLGRLRKDIKNLLRSFDYVTTFVDYYGFKDKGQMNVDELEKAIADACQLDDANRRKLIPYIQMHEYEALLFANMDCICTTLDALSGIDKGEDDRQKKCADRLSKIIAPYKDEPEKIDGYTQGTSECTYKRNI